jgi:hypothetical protein
VRVGDLNWMQLEAYLGGDDRIVLPVGSTEQHAYLSLETDNILAERASVEAAEPLGVPVLPVLPYGVTGFTAYPGSPTLLESTLVAVLSDVVDSHNRSGVRPCVVVGELPVDAASGSRDPYTAQAAGRVARGRSEGVEGSPRRRLVRWPLSAVIGGRKPTLGGRGPGDPYASGSLGGIEEAATPLGGHSRTLVQARPLPPE